MAKPNLKSLLTLLFSTLFISICGATNLASNNRKIVTNPANFPTATATATATPTPTIVTIPSSNPTPGTTPSPWNNVPSSTPAVITSAGQSWCVAQANAPQSVLQSALDYACGIGAADCSSVQPGAPCFNPNSLQNHASFAFNSYFQKNPVPTSCDFGGAALIVNTNPSSGSCIYPSSAAGAGTAIPASTFPPATTSSTNGASGSSYGGGGSPYVVPTSGSYGSPPSLMNSSYPGPGFPTSDSPDSPPTGIVFPAGAVTASASTQPCITFIILIASLSITKLILSTWF